jgi:hypothetical protein
MDRNSCAMGLPVATASTPDVIGPRVRTQDRPMVALPA